MLVVLAGDTPNWFSACRLLCVEPDEERSLLRITSTYVSGKKPIAPILLRPYRQNKAKNKEFIKPKTVSQPHKGQFLNTLHR